MQARLLLTYVFPVLFLLAGGWLGGLVAPANAGQPLFRVAQTADPSAATIRIAILGDSLTSGYGLASPSQSFPAVLEQHLRQQQPLVTILNHGVSGDTSTGGLGRVDWLLLDRPDIVVIALGGNDGLRGSPPSLLFANLIAITERLLQAEVIVGVLSVPAPDNFGAQYKQEFQQVFEDLGNHQLFQDHGQRFPNMLAGVAGVADLNQADRIHPNPDGVRLMVSQLAPYFWHLIALHAASPTA